MTSIVGILCKDGVVIGADSSVTFSDGINRTIEQSSEKIEIIDRKIIIAGTGQVGLRQRFTHIVKEAWEQKQFVDSELKLGTQLARNTLIDFESTGIRPPNIEFGALLAFPIKKTHFLCEFAGRTFQPEFKTEKLWYVSMGIAQPITDTFLGFIREIFWKEGLPSINDGTFAAVWTLEHAIQVNSGGVNGPVQVAILEKSKNNELEARILGKDELGEHSQAVNDAKEALREFKNYHQKDDSKLELPIINDE